MAIMVRIGKSVSSAAAKTISKNAKKTDVR
jgi:hypothetical protein